MIDYTENWNMYKNLEAAAKRFHIWTEPDEIGYLFSEGCALACGYDADHAVKVVLRLMEEARVDA